MTCSRVALANFTKQLATLSGAGVPLHEALELLSRDESEDLSIWVVPELTKKVVHGYKFSTSLSAYPRIFPNTYIALIRAAEETGQLVQVLQELGDWLDRSDKTARHVKKALTYPVVVLIISGLLTLGLFRTVIPGILDTVLGLGVELPAPTMILKGIVTVIQEPIFWLLCVAAFIGVSLYLQRPEGRSKALWVSVRLPGLGGILRYSAASRFAQTLGMLMETGVEITRATRISLEASGHPTFQDDAARIIGGLKEGKNLSEMLRHELYPVLTADLAKVGDESGRMASLLKRAGQILDEDTRYRVDNFLNVLEPVVLAGISIMVGFVVVAILMPLSTLTASL